MKKTLLAFFLCVLSFPGFSLLCAAPAAGMTNAEIETILTNYSEPGYKFIEKINSGMWKVLYARPGWEFGWEVIIATTSPEPENSFVVIGTSILSAKTLAPELLLKLLDENSLDTNPGSYAVFTEESGYSVQYAVKMPQMLMNEDVLKEAVGFVAGYSNSRVRDLEKILGAQKDETSAPTENSPAGSASDKSPQAKKDSAGANEK